MSGTFARVLTAIVLIPIVVSLVLWGPTWLVACVVALIVLFALHEFFALGAKMNMPGFPRFTMVCAVPLVMSAGLTLHRLFSDLGVSRDSIYPPFYVLFGTINWRDGVLLLFLVGIASLTLRSRRGIGSALPDCAVSAAGLLFIGWSLSRLVELHSEWPELLLFTLVVVWVGDTAAFQVGRAIGKHLLAPIISPKKSWEGAIANMLGSVLVGLVVYKWQLVKLPFLQCISVVVIVSVAGQMGDLFESAWKRGAGVKDSGSLLPGHGGILDRIDALLLAAPAVWWYFRIFIQTQ